MPTSLRPALFAGLALLSLCFATALGSATAAATPAPTAEAALDRVQTALRGVSAPSGTILLDRAIPLSDLAALTGSKETAGLRAFELRQLGLDLGRALAADPAAAALVAGTPERLAARVNASSEEAIPFAVVDVPVSRIRPDAADLGWAIVRGDRVQIADPRAFQASRVVAAGPLVDRTYRGAARFRIDAGHSLLTAGEAPTLAIDFADGLGFVPVTFGQELTVRWSAAGEKLIRTRLTRPNGEVAWGSARFDVRALGTPAPTSTEPITATIPWGGTVATGEMFVYLAPGRTEITNPVIVVEGFDINNNLNWPELYDLLNKENLLEDLRLLGFDAVVLNFTEATDPIPRNGFLLVEAIENVKSRIAPTQDLAIIGASMGGLVSRWALCYLEDQGIDPRTRTFIAFDTPHGGANIPIGVQYWLQFFSGLSGAAGDFLNRLTTPAAREMLLALFASPPDATPSPDPARQQFLDDLAAIGDWPSTSRNVVVANGDGAGLGQPHGPGAQTIRYEYDSFLVDIVGNTWAMPGPGGQLKIFDGEIDYLIGSDENQEVTVVSSWALDSAPGGWRGSYTEMDTVSAPFGDIVALHPNHTFIPSVSALALTTTNLDYDIDGDPDLLSRTPADAVYFPSSGPSQEHVLITPESADWIKFELQAAPTDAPLPTFAAGRIALQTPRPNPLQRAGEVQFALAKRGEVRLELFDVTGRLVQTLLREERDAGAHSISLAAPTTSGVYFLRLTALGETRSTRMVVTR